MSDIRINTVVNKMVHHSMCESSAPEELKNEYIKSMVSHGTPIEKVDAYRFQSDEFLAQDKPLEAITALETCISESPHVPEAHINWSIGMSTINSGLMSFGVLTENSQDFIRVYERLLALGQVQLENQVQAIGHYSRLGKSEEANRLIALLHKAAPNIPQLREKRAEHLKLEQKSSEIETKKSERKLSTQEISALTKTLNEARSALSSGEYARVLNIVAPIIDRYGEMDEVSAGFYHTLGIALDYSGRRIDSIPIFFELHLNFPHQLAYAHSYLLSCQRFTKLAIECLRQKRDPKELDHYYRILDSFYYAPVEIATYLALKDINSERPTLFTLERLKARFALSPNDPLYLRLAYQIADSLGDEKWMKNIRDHLQELLAERPYDLELNKTKEEVMKKRTQSLHNLLTVL